MRAFRALPLAFAALLIACQPAAPADITPAELLNSIRVLGMRAEPPEIAPGATTVVDALVFDPALDPGNMTYVWVFCDPDPKSTLGTQCADQQNARDPKAFVQNAFFGQNSTVHTQLTTKPRGSYTAPTTLLDSLPMGSAARQQGVVVDVVLIAFESSDFLEVLADSQGTIPRTIATKSILVRDPGPDANVNPHLDSIRIQGMETEQGANTQVFGLNRIELSALPSHDSAQTYSRLLPDGRTVQQKEVLSVSWFTTGGKFEEGHDASTRTEGANPLHLLVDLTDPTQKYVDVYAILRDGRGGTDWGTRSLQTAQ